MSRKGGWNKDVPSDAGSQDVRVLSEHPRPSDVGSQDVRVLSEHPRTLLFPKGGRKP